DAGESARLQNVAVAAAGKAALTNTDGVATLDVPSGDQQVAIVSASLPAYFEAPPLATVSVPRQSALLLPVRLPIGPDNRPGTHLAIGDSIRISEGSRDRQGYRRMLQAELLDFFGRAEVIGEGVEGTQTRTGVELIEDALLRRRPAYTLIHYGT